MRHSRRAAGTLAAFILGVSGALSSSAAAQVSETRSTLAVTYREDDGTRVDMVGLAARPGNLGHAEVKRKDGRTRVELRMEPLPHPQTLGPQYTTYVLWAVAPEGRAENLAELPHSERVDVDATTSLPTFGLVVTAEPHAAVSRPGPRPVAENALRRDTEGRVQTGTVEYEVAPERDAAALGQSGFQVPLLVLGARNAVEMARAAGADEFADAELREAEAKLAALEQLSAGKDDLSKELEMMARDVMRQGEHARTLSAERREQAERAAERRAARSAVDRAQAEADDARAEAQLERQEAERERQEAARSAQDAARSAQEAALAAEARRLAEEEAARARQEAAQAVDERAALQQRLFESLSAILETRREARGLIVNLSDVLFDFDRATLTPGAREKLAKLAGVLIAYPGTFNIEIEGHTDAVGSDAYNLRLSRDRAQSVRDYLVLAGVRAAQVVSVEGLGEARPVASNDSTAGRQMNRRVELVITDLEAP